MWYCVWQPSGCTELHTEQTKYFFPLLIFFLRNCNFLMRIYQIWWQECERLCNFSFSPSSPQSGSFLGACSDGVRVTFHGETSNSLKEEETVPQSAWTCFSDVSYAVQECCVWPSVELGAGNEKVEEKTLQNKKKKRFLWPFYYLLCNRVIWKTSQQNQHCVYRSYINGTLWLYYWCTCPFAQGICSFCCVKRWYHIYQSLVLEAEDEYILLLLKSDLSWWNELC